MTSGIKFGCLCAKMYPADRLPDEPVDIGHGFRASGKMPEIDMEFWTSVLGTIQIGEMNKANLWAWVEMESDNVEIADEENNSLAERMNVFWWSLQLQEPPMIETAWIFAGNVLEGKHDIRSVSHLDRVFNHQSSRTRLDLGMLREAATTAAGYEEIIRGGGLKGRLNQGFHSFVIGTSSRYLEGGHVAFVRALEGILHPNRHKNRPHFVGRGAKVFKDLSRNDRDATELLTAIYNMRSEFIHCQPLARAFPDKDRPDAEKCATELRDATYTLAARTYRTILRDKKLADFFMKDDLGVYWGKVVEGRYDPPFRIELRPEDWKASEK